MKKLMTIVLAVVLIAGFTSTSNAQISIGAKAGIALPMGTFGDAVGMGFGGSAIGEYTLNDNMTLGLNIGVYSFAGKTISLPFLGDITGPSSTIIPIIADFKYYFSAENFKPYAGAGLGMYMFNNGGGSNLGISPKVGFWMGDGFQYGASIDYNMIFVTGGSNAYLGINVGILYPLGK
ncbi:MAG: hypothetical protein ACOYO1_11520 [Bacteroidales bacterium]